MREIIIPGFTTDTTPDDQLALSIFGAPGTGKTRFCITAPPPIGFIPLDRKSRKTVDMVKKELGVTVYMPEADLVAPINPMKLSMLTPDCAAAKTPDTSKPVPMCCTKHYHRWQVDRIKQATYALYEHPDIRTIVIDSGTAFYEDMMFAYFGRTTKIMQRDRGPINREMRDFYSSLSGKHLIITHEHRSVYKNDTNTGKFESSGWNKTGYNTNAEVEFVYDPGKGPNDASRFFINVHKCQSNPNIQGPGGVELLENDQITFQYLAMQMFPDSEPEDWDGSKQAARIITSRVAGRMNGKGENQK